MFGWGCFKLLIDVVITTLPIPLILPTKMSRKRRFGVTVLLSLGYIMTAAGAMRLYYTYLMFWKSSDRTWYRYLAFLSSVVENDLGVVSPLSIGSRDLSHAIIDPNEPVAQICASIPALRPLFINWNSSTFASNMLRSSRSRQLGVHAFGATSVSSIPSAYSRIITSSWAPQVPTKSLQTSETSFSRYDFAVVPPSRFSEDSEWSAGSPLSPSFPTPVVTTAAEPIGYEAQTRLHV